MAALTSSMAQQRRFRLPVPGVRHCCSYQKQSLCVRGLALGCWPELRKKFELGFRTVRACDNSHRDFPHHVQIHHGG